MQQRSSARKKPPTLSPNQKLLRSFYSKKSRSDHSPSAQRSISKEQIKQQIKKVVYNCSKHNERSLGPRGSDQSDVLSNHAEQPSLKRIANSLTPKNYLQSRRPEPRQIKTSKASQSHHKQMFVSSGRYDSRNNQRNRAEEKSKPYSVNKRIQGDYRPQGQFRQKEQYKTHQDQTLKFSQKKAERDQSSVKAYLTPEEFSKFGDRFPQKFKRVGLLGRGGFSLVWLGIHRTSKRKVAVKQILTKNPHQTHLKQIWFGSYFFQKGGQAREEFQNHIGINNLCRLYSYQITTLDSWLYYEICQETLGSSLFELKGQTFQGERTYRVQYKQLLNRMRSDQNELVFLLVEVAKALHLMNSHNIVHSDLKTQNILLRLRRKEEMREGKGIIKGVKLIDFGSSFLFTNLKQFSMATPEYMPPEILNYILFQNKLEYDPDMLIKMEKYKNPWVIDIWSLGCILLQIVSGVPLWMSVQTRIEQSDRKVTGLFSAKNRVFSKIIQKQIQVVKNMDFHLDNHNHSGINLNADLRKVLKKMLHLQPQSRISPLLLLRQLGVACDPAKIPSY